ncbi:MAG: histidine--tRNA ligase [Deltaproteobacteria bacterium]|nr:histidine--tRNA ligase [Deltaproteobacteria bacterium]
MEFTAIKGFKDILPEEIGYWQLLETEARRLLRLFGFSEIRTPLLEKTELFSRGIGQDTDIVSKEMYSLKDSKGRSLTLRPEATAAVARAYIQNRLYEKQPVQKLFSIGPMFRHERPQKGRLRQFHQINVEIFGDPGPKSDADVIILALELFHTIGLKDLTLHVNTLGCPECRPRFKKQLTRYLDERKENLCADCRRRATTNPLRVFDCKVPGCRKIMANAPSILDSLCDACVAHFRALKEYLLSAGVSFVPDHHLVRGLDYYTRTTFEIQTERLGAQNAVAGGGRYDGLVELLGGPSFPAIGFAVGMERVIALLKERGPCAQQSPDLFVAALGETAQKRSFTWMQELRRAGVAAEMDYAARGLKAQLKYADRLGAKKVLMIGDNELKSGKVILRDMSSGAQEQIDLDGLVEKLCEALPADE